MLKWLKSLFGFDVPDTPVIAQKPKVETQPAKIKAKKKAPTQKKVQKSVDLDAMSKNELLAHAKKNGVKANASMKKADILAAINKG